MTYEHLMIDIETLGTESNSVILSLAAVNFEIETGAYGQIYYNNISIQSCLDSGLIINADTLRWWVLQDTRVLKESFYGEISLQKVLTDFWSFCKNLDQKNIQVWGNSARFDLGLLENAYNKTGLLIPWSYYNERDVRTLVSFAPEIKEQTEFIGKKHMPVEDCLHQIKYCSKIWNALKHQK